MASTSERRQCIALAMIMMLSVAEARRVSEYTNLVRAAANHRDVHEEFDEHAVVLYSPRSDLTKRMTKTDTAVTKIQDGKGFWGAKYCILSCPGLWVKVAYNSWKMRSTAKTLIDESFGVTGKPLELLAEVDQEDGKPLATSFNSVMRKTVWTFVKAVDQSIVQRTLLTLLMGPLGLFRAITGMSPLGLCFLKAAWEDIHEHDEYEQYATGWWAGMLAGCPDTPSDASFKNEDKTARLVDSMVLALAKQEGFGESDDEAKWADQATHKQCVHKLSRAGVWQNRELSIEKGIISWRATRECDSGFQGIVKTGLGSTKSFAMQFLTTPSGVDEDLVQLFYNKEFDANCIKMQNAHRKFEFCPESGADMNDAKRIIDDHIALLGSERALFAAASKVDRLVAAASFEDEGNDVKEEQAKLNEGDDNTGDTSVQGLQALGEVSSDLKGEEAEQARKILRQIKEASSLIATGQDFVNGTALLQEAFADAHLNQHLSTIMRGEVSQNIGRQVAAQAAAGGTVTMTELLIILIICGGGFFCLYIGFHYAASNLQESERLEVYTDLKRNSTKATFPHAPLA